MRPTTNSTDPAEDLHSILNRFQNWAGKQPENQNGHGHNGTGVREIPMEEAIRQLRSGRATTTAGSVEKQAPTQPQKAPATVETNVEPASQGVSVSRPIAPVAKATETLGIMAQAIPLAKTAATAMKKPAAKRKGPLQAAGAAPSLQPARKPAAVRRSAAKTPTKQTKTTGRPSASKRASTEAVFREVLARSIPAELPDKKPERRNRVSVRLSSAEERQLQRLASQEGITISEYLRRSALQAKTADGARSTAPKAGLRHGRPATAAPLFASANSENASVLGVWLTLLRNRFLASPARFAERA